MNHGMMMADVILLNTFNSLGLPTSTTVSLVFELLGAAVAVALYKIWIDPSMALSDIGLYINIHLLLQFILYSSSVIF